MNYAQAKLDAMTAGIPEDQLTPAVLKQFGWTPHDPTEGFPPITTAVTKDELKDDLAKLDAEAKANNVPAAIIKGIVSLGMKAIAL